MVTSSSTDSPLDHWGGLQSCCQHLSSHQASAAQLQTRQGLWNLKELTSPDKLCCACVFILFSEPLRRAHEFPLKMPVNIFSIPSSSALLLFSLAFGLTEARPWQGATKTVVYQGDDWSPRPTNILVNPRELFKRDHVDVAVCGWIGGNSASPAACASGSSCVHDTLHGYIGCCATSGPCTAGVYTSCVDENSPNWGEESGLVDTGIYTWCVDFCVVK
jgi:hypothetical protein